MCGVDLSCGASGLISDSRDVDKLLESGLSLASRRRSYLTLLAMPSDPLGWPTEVSASVFPVIVRESIRLPASEDE